MKRLLLVLITMAMVVLLSGHVYAGLDDGLRAWYPFTGNANDASGNGYSGTTHAGVSLTADRFSNADSAYAFDGTTDGLIELDFRAMNGLNAFYPVTTVGPVTYSKTD